MRSFTSFRMTKLFYSVSTLSLRALLSAKRAIHLSTNRSPRRFAPHDDGLEIFVIASALARGNPFLNAYKIYFVPVDPNPPVPLAVSSKSSTSVITACSCLAITIWAILMPRVMVKSTCEWLIKMAQTSPR
jgi:hypothetical protein